VRTVLSLWYISNIKIHPDTDPRHSEDMHTHIQASRHTVTVLFTVGLL